MKLQLPQVTQIIVDCVDINRALKALNYNKRYIKFATSKLLSSIPHPHVIKIDPLNSIQEYSNFMVKHLVNHFRTSHVLVAQHDGFIINPRLWTTEFLKFDYIGAPWPEQWLVHGYSKEYNVGNGGFSLRSRKLQQALQDPNIICEENEDVTICQKYRPYLEKHYNIKFAPKELAEIFSREYPFHNNPTFGQHGNLRFQ